MTVKRERPDRPATRRVSEATPTISPGRERTLPKDRLDTLIALYQRGELEDLVRRASALVEEFPQEIVLHNILGAANAGLRRYDAAIESYRRAIRLRPDYAEAYNNLGAALKDKGDLEAAIASYTRALEIRPDYAVAHNNLGAALKEKGDLEGAIASYNRALEIRPDYAEAHSNLGNALKEKGELTAAIESHNRALEIRPDYAAAHSNLGNALQEKGDISGAIASHNRALQIRPDFAEAHFNLGNALREEGDLSAAIDSFERAIRIKPDYAEAYYNLGAALKEDGELSRAIESYRRATRIRPDFAAAHFNLGNVLQEQSEFLAAVDSYQRALRSRPDDPEVHYNIGTSYRALSMHRHALSHFQHSNFKDSESFELECLYLLGEEKLYLEKNAQLYNRNSIDAVMGALSSHAEVRFEKTVPNAFCASPMDYIYSSEIYASKGFFDKLVYDLNSIRNVAREQSLLINGLQTTGNIFSVKNDSISKVQSIIRHKIEEYKNVYATSKEPFIRRFPESYSINGWILSIKNQGFLKSHIHEYSWISGTIYINIPKKLKDNEGNISFSTHGGFYPGSDKKYPEKIIEVDRGVINLFPSSLFHRTIPFNSDEERISLAFDIRPS